MNKINDACGKVLDFVFCDYGETRACCLMSLLLIIVSGILLSVIAPILVAKFGG